MSPMLYDVSNSTPLEAISPLCTVLSGSFTFWMFCISIQSEAITVMACGVSFSGGKNAAKMNLRGGLVNLAGLARISRNP